MTRPPAYIFDSLVTIIGRPTRGSAGMIAGAQRVSRPAFIDLASQTVTDERDGMQGQEVVVAGTVHTFVEDYAAPGSTMILRPGTPQERQVQVVTAALFDHKLAPEHCEMTVV